MSDTCIGIRESTNAAEVRRAAVLMASQLTFDEAATGAVGLVVTEVAKNLLKHAGGGQMILRPLDGADDCGLEMLAVDKGPGIADPTRWYEDGYSTAGTAGTGMGAIARLSTSHEIYTRPGQGTVLMAHFWKKRMAAADMKPRARFRTGAVSVPMAGESVCGDAWGSRESGSTLRIIVADGLGHGPAAAQGAEAAVRIAQAHPNDALPHLLQRVHEGLRSTRGAAVALAEIDAASRVVRFAGLGNITGVVLPPDGPVRHMVSHAGTAGHEARRILEFTYPWESKSLLIMHSDGLQTRWSMDGYPGLLDRHPSVIAGVLYRDYTRGRDDVTVVAAAEARPDR